MGCLEGLDKVDADTIGGLESLLFGSVRSGTDVELALLYGTDFFCFYRIPGMCRSNYTWSNKTKMLREEF